MTSLKRKQNDFEVRGSITAIFLTRRDGTILETIIDTDDFDKVRSFPMSWYASPIKSKYGFYAYSHLPIINGYREFVALHRFILDCPKHLVVDHFNHDTLDNRRCNLRIVTSGQNSENQELSKANQCGFRGVIWNKQKGKWRAQIKCKGKMLYFGHYNDPTEAGRAVAIARSIILPYSHEAQMFNPKQNESNEATGLLQ